jgi:hypothetical protein
VTIHGIGHAAGTQFIAYEFVDGRTLRDLTRSASLDAATAIEIGMIAGAADDDPLRQLAAEPRVKTLLDGMRLPNRV